MPAPRRALATALLAVLAAVPAAAATPVGPEIELNQAARCVQDLPAAARLAGGETVVAWTSAAGAAYEGVGARIAGWPGPAGPPLGGDELRLDDGPAPLPGSAAYGVALAPAAGGGFYAAWWGRGGLHPDLESFLYLREFDAGGEPAGEIVEAGALGGPAVTGAALATDGQGRPAIAWRDGTGALWLRLFEADLTPRGGLIVVDGPAGAPPTDGVFHGHFWVFFGGLTDLEYTIAVEDRFRPGSTWTFANPARTLTSRADTRALPADPCPVCAAAPAMTRSAQGDGTP